MSDTKSPVMALLYGALIVFATLPFGSVTPGWRLVPSVVIPLLMVVVLWRRQGRGAALPARLPAALIASVAALGFLQTVPVPSTVLARVSPLLHSRLPDQAHPLSVAPTVTWTVSLWWLVCAGGVVVAAAVGRDRQGRRTVAGCVLGAGLLQALYGGQRFLGEPERIWGVVVPTQDRRLRGTFVNPDHLAFYLALAIPLAFALLWWVLERRGWRDRAESRLLMGFGALLVLATLLVALALTGSRGGLVAMAIAVAVQGALFARASGRRLWALSGAAVLVGGIAVLTWLSLDEQGLQRLLETSRADLTESHRLAVYGATAELWRGAPLFGVGLGAFREALPLVRPPELDREWWHAHSDILELLASTGLAGILIIALLLALTVHRLSRAWRSPRRSEDLALTTALLSCVIAALAHSLVDFSLTIPANALALTALGGLAWSLPLAESGDGPRERAPASAQESELEQARGRSDVDRQGQHGLSPPDVEGA